MEERLQKFLAEAGIGSRRTCEGYITEGRVRINGNIVTELGTKVDGERDEIIFDGKKVNKSEKLVYIMLHKPEGYVTTASDQFERATVMDLLDEIEERVFPVGRLDYDTSGLLLLTNDGDLTYKLTHPKHNVEKVYIAMVEEEPTEDEMGIFRRGIMIDGYKTKPAKIFITRGKGRYVSLKIIIHEGRNRQVRKMCEAINHPVRHLKRIATGKLTLGDLKKGEYRHLTSNEVNYLMSL